MLCVDLEYDIYYQNTIIWFWKYASFGIKHLYQRDVHLKSQKLIILLIF